MSTIYKILAAILGIMMIVSGIYCLCTPGLTFLVVGWIIGFDMVADAIGNILTWKWRKDEGMADGWTLAGAIVSLAFGIMLLGSNLLQLSMDLFVAYMAASWVMVIGILRLVRAFKLRELHKELSTQVQAVASHWWVVLLNGILLIAVGIIGMINPAVMAIAIGTMMGLHVVVVGTTLIITAWAA
jgi:uncharacterized membrane protein HdeD (DUF308 family)